jgi:GTP-binding protein
MKVSSAEFIKSAYEEAHWAVDSRPEIAFLGRSNVGKSSLLNTLLNRKGLARTSNTPGRTQCINFFLVNDSFYFVDLPGYGYAKVPKTMRSDWGKMAEEYLSLRRQLKLSIQLVDSRHEPSKLDLQLNEWLHYNNRLHIVVATKTDKLKPKKLIENLDIIKNAMPGSDVFPYSSETIAGKDDLWREIQKNLLNT